VIRVSDVFKGFKGLSSRVFGTFLNILPFVKVDVTGALIA